MDESTVKKPRARRTKKSSENTAALNLLEALRFVLPALKKVGTVQQQFCMFKNGWLVAANDSLMIGTQVDIDLNACPHAYQLFEALQNCGQELSIVQLSAGELFIKSGDFKANVPCVDESLIVLGIPDSNVAKLNNDFKTAVEKVACLAVEGAQNALNAGVYVGLNVTAATNNFAIIEALHGFDLPQMLIPKQAILALTKTKKDLSGFGYSGSTATFWFSQNSFITTCLFSEKFIAYESLLECQQEFSQVSEEFFSALKAIEPFCKNNIVYFNEGFALSSSFENASSYKLNTTVPNKMAFNLKFMLQLKEVFKNTFFDENKKRVYFKNGINARGVLSAVQYEERL